MSKNYPKIHDVKNVMNLVKLEEVLDAEGMVYKGWGTQKDYKKEGEKGG
jgi:hypothetical protein